MSSFTRFHGKEGEYVSLEQLLDWIRDPKHRLADGRAIPVMIWGSTGVGKCLRANQKVVVDGRLVPIGELWDNYAGERELPSDGVGEWAIPTAQLTVPALDSSGQALNAPVGRLYRQRVREMGRRVTLDDGSVIVMTNRHRLLGVDDWQRDITEGDVVCVPSRIPTPPAAASLDPDMLVFLAWQISEGHECASAPEVTITQGDSTVLERVREVAQRFGEQEGIKLNSMPLTSKPSGGKTPSTAWRAWLREHGYEWGKLSAEKKIPDFVVSADLPSLRCFLREYFAAEAHVSELSYSIQLSSASRELIDQIALMLRRFGIWFRVRSILKAATNGSRIKRQYWEGRIAGESLRAFAREIGIADERKQATLERICEKQSNSNIEGVPISDLLRELEIASGMPRKRLGIESVYFKRPGKGSRRVATQALATVGPLLDGSAEERFESSQFATQNHPTAHQIREAFAALDRASLDDLGERISQRLLRECFYARVTKVDDVWLDEFVYDLEVPGHHNYVAGGIWSHNTSVIKAYCAKHDLELRAYHPAHDVDGTDLVGEMTINAEGLGEYVLPPWLPREDDPPGLLFVDEINRAPELVLAGLMEPLGEGTISQSGWKLPSHWAIITAANPFETGYDVNQVDEAMVARMLHYAPGWDAPAWVAWAAREGIDRRVIDFALRNPGVISSGEPQLPLEIVEKLRPTPRSLEYFGRLYEPGMTEGLLRVVATGLLGREAAQLLTSELALADQPLKLADLNRGEYEGRLRAWNADKVSGVAMINASSSWIAADLLIQEPVSDDPFHEPTAQRVGHYLARLQSQHREDALEILARSAPRWAVICRQAGEIVLAARARKRGGLTGPGGAAH